MPLTSLSATNYDEASEHNLVSLIIFQMRQAIPIAK
jgi:hypothetical protein